MPVLGVWTHFSPDLCGRNWGKDQIPHSDEVVSSGRKSEYPFTLDLTYFVSGVSRGAAVKGAAASTFVVLRHMRCDVHASYLPHELFGIVALVGSHRHTLSAFDPLGHEQRRVPFCCAIGLQQLPCPPPSPLWFPISTLPQ